MTRKARQKERRQYAREFKLSAIGRMQEAGNVTALAEELGIRRELLYEWRKLHAAGGPGSLKSPGRPRPVPLAAEGLASDQRIAALERKVGEQALLIDFFKGALQRIEESRRASGSPGGTASSRRSTR